MKIKKILAQSAFFSMNKKIGLHFGWDATAVLCSIIDASEMFEDWFYQTEEMIKDKTGVSADRQAKFIKIFVEAGFIQKKVAGIPAKRFFKINDNAIFSFIFDDDSVTENCGNLKQESVEYGDKLPQITVTTNRDSREHIYRDKEISNKEISNKEIAQAKALDAPPKKRNVVDWDWTDRIVERFGVSEQVAQDFIAMRKAKRAVITETVLDNFQKEVKKVNDAGVYFAEREAFVYWAAIGWQGFKAEWYLKGQTGQAKTGYKRKETFEECMARLSKSESVRVELDVTPSKNKQQIGFIDYADDADPFAY
jgi:hypothetical protein